MKSINFYLRLVLGWLGLGFAFFIGNLLLPLYWKNPNSGKIVAGIVSLVTRYILGIKIVIHNPERLQSYRPFILIGNHQSNLDVFTCSQLYVDNMVMIGKKELKYLPFFGSYFYLSGHILLDRKNRRSAVEALKEVTLEIKNRSLNLVIFPEGTRNFGAEKLLPFKKGAFVIATETGFPIIPFVIQRLPHYFDHCAKKLGSARSGGEVHIHILEPIYARELGEGDAGVLMRKTQELMQAEVDKMEKLY